MASVNKKIVDREVVATAPGALASRISPTQQLRRSVMACLLWENIAYEDGESVADRIKTLVPKVAPETVSRIAIEAREVMKLRHVPLLLVREMARHHTHKHLVSWTLSQVIQRPDEITEFLAIYWRDDKDQPLSAQVKKGIARAFNKFNAYQLQKYNRDGSVRLRDAMFMTHPKPLDAEDRYTIKERQQKKRKRLTPGEKVFKDLAQDTLPTPDTWETELSAGKDKRKTWERLLSENKLGALAFIRNLRNMEEAGVNQKLIESAFRDLDVSRVLPFRFLAAAQHAPRWQEKLEKAMMGSLASQKKLLGKTVIIVDVSGSMSSALSFRSEMSRMDAAIALAIMIRGVSENAVVYATAGNDGTRIHDSRMVPNYQGFALRDAIRNAEQNLGGGGIFLKQVMDYVYKHEREADRVIVITDEQDCDLDQYRSFKHANAFGVQNYLLNVGNEKNGIGYDKFVHIDGFSEAVVDFIQAHEAPVDSSNDCQWINDRGGKVAGFDNAVVTYDANLIIVDGKVVKDRYGVASARPVGTAKVTKPKRKYTRRKSRN